MQVVQGFQDLIKELKEYGDKQKERHKQVKCPLCKNFQAWQLLFILDSHPLPCQHLDVKGTLLMQRAVEYVAKTYGC